MTIFVFVLVGVRLTQVISDKSYENTDMAYDSIVNESNTITGCICGAELCATTACNYTITKTNVQASTITVKNCTGTDMVLDTDYKVDSADDDSVKLSYLYTQDTDGGISACNNISYIAYDRYQDNYVQGSEVSRTIIGLNKIWFVLGILLIVAGTVLGYLRKNEMI